mmetsp:Transcript_20922/g.36270  ORF Transcript_20922/g.36270 Transcript_20922/m.36270 type:complete len:292 (+) Transcript_20922:85-960(+)
MQKRVLVLACLAGASLGRRVQAPSSESAKSQAFATLLASLSPDAAAFQPSSPGPVRATAQRSQEPSMQYPSPKNVYENPKFVDKSQRGPEDPYAARSAFSGEEGVREELFPYAYAPTEWDKPEEEFDVKNLPGISAPLGFFDPFGFTKGASKAKIAKYREAELKHGRVAMLAAWGMITADKFHPFFDGKLSRNPLLAIVQTPKLGILQILLFITFVEVLQVSKSKMPDDIPGNFLYGFPRPDDELWNNYQTRELNNGRLAMFGSIGMLVGSYISAKGPLEVLETPGKILTR